MYVIGHATVHLIGLNGVSRIYERIRYTPHGSSSVIEVPSSDLLSSTWSALSSCQVIILTINSEDNEQCAQKMCELISEGLAVTVFSIQRGVLNSSMVKEMLVPSY